MLLLVLLAHAGETRVSFVSDSFTGNVVDQPLTAHAGEIGSSWIAHPLGGAGSVSLSGTGSATGAGTSLLLASGVPMSADYIVSATVRHLGGVPGTIGVVGRFSTTVLDGYMLRVNAGASPPRLELWKYVAGSPTQLGSTTMLVTLPAPGTTTSLELECLGSTIIGRYDGVELIRITDTSINRVGRAGIRSVAAGTATSGIHLDDLLATTGMATVTLAGFADHQVFQRTIGGTSGPVRVSGTCPAVSAADLQARVLLAAGGAEVVPWTTVALVSAGAFNGTLTVPQGGWYVMEARARDSFAQTLAQTATALPWGVGINILCIGQSNMYGFGSTTYTLADDRVGLYRQGAGWQHLVDPWLSSGKASCGPALGNALVAALNVPVGLIPSANLGSPLIGTTGNAWEYRNPANHADASTFYGKALGLATAAGGVEFVAFSQGATEAVAVPPPSTAAYVAAFQRLKSYFDEDLPAGSQVRWVVSQVGRKLDGANFDAGYDLIREAHRMLDDGTNVLLTGSTMDLPIGDGVSHYSQVGQDTHGRRFAMTIQYLLGQRSTYGGPRVTSARFTDASRTSVTVVISHRGGTDFTPTSSIPGFVLSDLSGVKTSSAARTASDTIVLTCASPCTGATTLRYLAGKNPAGPAGLVVDNQSDPAPLLPISVPMAVTDPPAIAPTIGGIADLVIDEDTVSPAVALTVGDLDTPAANLVLSATSSNPALVDASGLAHAGTPGAPTLTITPTADRNGSALITVVVADDGSPPLTASTSFLLTVRPLNDPPGLTTIAVITAAAGAPLGREDQTCEIPGDALLAAWNAFDVDGAAPTRFRVADLADGILSVRPAANPDAVPTPVAVGDILSGTNQVLVWTPAANASGTLTVCSIQSYDGESASPIPVALRVTVAADGFAGAPLTMTPLPIVRGVVTVYTFAEMLAVTDVADAARITTLRVFCDPASAPAAGWMLEHLDASLAVVAADTMAPGTPAGTVVIARDEAIRVTITSAMTSPNPVVLAGLVCADDARHDRTQSAPLAFQVSGTGGGGGSPTPSSGAGGGGCGAGLAGLFIGFALAVPLLRQRRRPIGN